MSTCPACSARDLVEIDLAPGGRRMRFATCRTCEHRWWRDLDGGSVALGEVLMAVAPA